MKKFRNKAMAIAVSFAMIFTCFATFTVTSFADETTTDETAFTVTTNYYQADADVAAAEPVQTVTRTYTDAEFKALGEDQTNARYAFYKNGWNLFNVTHGVSLQALLEDNNVEAAGLQTIQLTDWYKGAAETYAKCEYQNLYNADGYFFPNTKGTDTALNLEGGYTVPNAVIATTYAQTTVTDETTLGDADAGEAVEKFAAASSSDYRMMIGGDAEGNINGKSIGGYAFCSGVSGIIVKTTAKVPQTLEATGAAKTLKYKKVKKAKQTIKGAVTVEGAQGDVTFSKVKVNKKAGKFTVKANGSIVVKKKTPKGTYKVTVEAAAAETDVYAAATTTTVVKIKIK